MKKGLVINCSPVKNGATAEIVKIISEIFLFEETLDFGFTD